MIFTPKPSDRLFRGHCRGFFEQFADLGYLGSDIEHLRSILSKEETVLTIETYRRVIQEWCDASGMSPWATDANMHVDINDTTIGLIYAADQAPDTLFVFVDLGVFEHPDLHRHMLELNMLIDPNKNGQFALHPESGGVVYRVDLPLTQELNGAAMPQQIAAMVDQARSLLLS
ncbi:MAG TPA: CesT family type III secretion system chaperone [Burkholderiaceae bacterium]|nr:CesT family type III secretion system chaperone [Burkholderiaceae bacterium]